MKYENHLRIARSITKLLEGQFAIGKMKFGLDAVIGFFPVLGDIIPAALSFYLIWIGLKIELPGNKIAEMITNIVLDFVLGTVPLVGDIADFFFKSNIKNMAIIEDHMKKIVPGEIIE